MPDQTPPLRLTANSSAKRIRNQRLLLRVLRSGQHSFHGNVYNLRLWDYAMTEEQLKALGCDAAGNVIDWDNSYWNIPSSLAQTDAALSCSESSHHQGGVLGLSNRRAPPLACSFQLYLRFLRFCRQYQMLTVTT